MAQSNQLAKGATGTAPNYRVQVQVDRVLDVGASILVYRNGTLVGNATTEDPGSRRYEYLDNDVPNGSAVYTAQVVVDSYTAPLSAEYGVTVNATASAKIDISAWPYDMRSFFFLPSDDFLTFDADFNQEVLNRWVKANGNEDKFMFAANATIEFAHVTYQSSSYVQVTVEMGEDQYYTGTGVFIYERLTGMLVYGGTDSFSTLSINTDEVDALQAIRGWYEEQNVMPPYFGALGYIPVTVGTPGYVTVDLVESENLYWYQGAGFNQPINMRFAFAEVTPHPYEAVFDFSVTSAGVVPVLSGAINVGPTQMEVLSTTSSYTDPTIPIVGVNTGVSLPVGSYTVRVFYADSRNIVQTTSFNRYVGYAPGLKITRLRKLKGSNLDSGFVNMTTLTTIDGTAFQDGALNIGSFSQTFIGCTGLTALPVGLLDGVARCMSFSNMFRDCSNIASLPSGLLKNFDRPIWQSFQRGTGAMFQRCYGLTALPSGLFQNLTAVSYESMFQGCSNLTTVPGDLFVGTFDVIGQDSSLWWYLLVIDVNNLYYDVGSMFDGCRLSSIPVGLFDVFRTRELPVRLQLTFQNNTTLTTIPAGLFNDLRVWSAFAYTTQTRYQFQGTFSGCTGITSIPAGLFDNLTTVEGDISSGLYALGPIFYNCSSLTALPAGLLKNKPNLKYLYQSFSLCPIDTLENDLFAGSNQLIEVRSVFSGCQLTSLPAGLFKNQPNLKMLDRAVALNMYTSVPADIVSGCPQLEVIDGLFAGTIITSVPAGLFSGCNLKSITSVFYGTTNLHSVPANLFDFPLIYQASSTFELSGLTALPAKLFGTNSNSSGINFQATFKGTQISVVPDEFLYGLDKVTSLYEIFRDCPLTSVGKLVYNKLNTGSIDVRGAFRNSVSFTVPPNFITSDVVVTLDKQTGSSDTDAMFSGSSPAGVIDTMFGANVRFNGTQFFKNVTSLTGSGNAFITKHSVPSTQIDLFMGCTGLSDYGSLPSWAL